MVPLKDRLVPRASIERGIVQLRAALAAFHKQNPLLPGMPRASAPLPAFLLEAALSAGKDLVAEGELLRLASHRLQLKAEEDEAASKMEALFRDGGLSVPALNEVLANSGLDANRSRNLLQLLLREGRLVRVSPELIFHREAIQRLRELLAAHKGESFAVPEFKEWTGISRKYAIPLLEFLDRERLTRREKERRLVL